MGKVIGVEDEKGRELAVESNGSFTYVAEVFPGTDINPEGKDCTVVDGEEPELRKEGN